MDELLRDFLTETTEHIEGAENQLVQFERDPSDASLIASIFRLVHTIKGTSSFLGLDRLQRVAHAAETVLGEIRDGAPATPPTVSAVLGAIDRFKSIIEEIEANGAEPDGDDTDIIQALESRLSANAGAHDAAHHSAPAAPAVVNIVASEAPAVETTTSAAVVEQDADSDDHGEAGEGGGAGKPPGGNRPSGQGGAGNSKTPESIRVAVDTIERIMQLVSELVLTRNQLLELTRHRNDDAIKSPLQRLSTLTSDLQDAVMRARMQPVGRLFSSLPRLVRELSSELNKKINLVTEGADTELDRQLIEVLRDPLTHMIRNCADHGIERPEERVATGKSETGEIRVSAAHEAGQITIDIADDGRGLNLEKIKKKIVSSGLATEQELSSMHEDEIYRYIFEPGFSTAAAVTSVSGRGVGMDVVRSNIESIGGSVTLSSNPGRGSRFSMKIPLTLAIAPALIIGVGGQRFALPEHAVVEAVGLDKSSRHQVERLQNALVLKLREEVLPIVDLRPILGLDDSNPPETDDRLVVVMRVAGESFGVIVDVVDDIQEIVVKPLSGSLAHLNSFTGHTILGDGSVVLILDPSGIAAALGIEKSSEKKREAAAKEAGMRSIDKTSLVMFRAGSGALKVLPLSLVSRMEAVEASRIQYTDGKLLMLHHGRLMPLAAVSSSTDVSFGTHPVLVISFEGRTMGLLVDEIVDIVEQQLDIQLTSGGADLLGTAEIKGQMVEVVDISYYLQATYPSGGQKSRSPERRVLLVADNPFVRELLVPALSAEGYEVLIAQGSGEAMEHVAKSGGIRAVVIDTDLAGLSGYRIGQAIRRERHAGELPIIGIASSAASPAVQALAHDHGFTSTVGKLDRQYLISTLASALEAVADHEYTSAEKAA